MQNNFEVIEPSQEDPKSVSINIKSVKNDFIRFLKKLFIPVHTGDYLKIMFESRLVRDLFLLRIKEW